MCDFVCLVIFMWLCMCQCLCVSIYLYPAQTEEQGNKKTTKIFINHLHVNFVIRFVWNVVRTEKTK
ncbi:hypothetical protein [Shigella phage ESh4]|nr:hypothetical protein [Shigella phage ESh4]